MAPRQPIPVREILYQLSPYQQDVIKQTIYNAPKTFLKFWKEVRKYLNVASVLHALTQQSTVCWLLSVIIAHLIMRICNCRRAWALQPSVSPSLVSRGERMRSSLGVYEGQSCSLLGQSFGTLYLCNICGMPSALRLIR